MSSVTFSPLYRQIRDRLLHSLHDLGLHTGSAGRWVFYGFAALGSLACAVLLLGAF